MSWFCVEFDPTGAVRCELIEGHDGPHDFPIVESVPRYGYDYPTTLQPLCAGAPDRGFDPRALSTDAVPIQEAP